MNSRASHARVGLLVAVPISVDGRVHYDGPSLRFFENTVFQKTARSRVFASSSFFISSSPSFYLSSLFLPVISAIGLPAFLSPATRISSFFRRNISSGKSLFLPHLLFFLSSRVFPARKIR